MGHHIVDGKFQSDKFPDLAPDKIVLSFKDPAARAALLCFARETTDRELAEDIWTRLNSLAAEEKAECQQRMEEAAPPVDRSARTLIGGGPIPDDHREINPETGQQKGYVVLSAEERAKGFVRPVRRSYQHVGGRACKVVTTMARELAETYARDPGFYSGTFCAGCRAHFPLAEFVWEGTDEVLGS